MREVLGDIVRQTSSLFNVVRITGTDDSTVIQATDDSKTLFLKATLEVPAPEFNGQFGIANLGILNGLLNFASYKTEDAGFAVHRKVMREVETVSEFQFRDSNGQGADFRTMNAQHVGEQAEIRSVPWEVTVVPDKAKIAEFSQLAGLYSEIDKFFSPKVVDGNLVFGIGGEETSGHRVSMVFARDVEGTLSKGGALYSAQMFLSVIKNAGSHPVTVSLYGPGLLGVSVKTPIATYDYYMRHKH
jgi:hypothetical protein